MQVVRINYVPSASNIRSRLRRLSIQDKNLAAAPPESSPVDEAAWGYRIKVVPVALCRRGHLAVATSKRFCDEFAKLVAVMGTWRVHEDEGLVALVNKMVQERNMNLLSMPLSTLSNVSHEHIVAAGLGERGSQEICLRFLLLKKLNTMVSASCLVVMRCLIFR